MDSKYFDTLNFRYVKDKHGFIPDALFIYQDGRVFQVTFDQNEGWYKSVKRTPGKYPADKVLGVVKEKVKKFRIYLEDECIEWTHRYIDKKDIIS